MKKGKKKQQKEIPEPGTENRTGISREFAGEFATRLLEWYAVHKRNLPWRETTDPYRIWISEIILQQTRVAQGLEYFNRFTERFPDVASLANASEDEVMNYWQGLGYYSRARNLHAAAKNIMERFGGVFPTDYRDVLSLKGVGEYTAAAICSFAYRAPYAVLDGNVYRILARILGIGMPADSPQAKKYFTAIAEELLDKDFPDDYNQAIMDFGAIQCVPQSPRCPVCPFTDRCAAFRENRVDDPVRKQMVGHGKGPEPFQPACFPYQLPVFRKGFDFGESCGPRSLDEGKFIQILPDIFSRAFVQQDIPPAPDMEIIEKPFLDGRLSFFDGKGFHPVFHEMESLRLSPCSMQGEAAATATTTAATGNVLGEAAATAAATAATGNVLGEPTPPEYANPSAATKYIVIPENKIKDYPVPRLIESYLEYTVGTLPL